MMKRIDLEGLNLKNDYGLDDFIREVKREMQFIKYGENYIIKHSNGKVVSKKEKLELEKNNIIEEDCGCGVEKIKKVSKINKKIKEASKEVVDDTIEETSTTI